MSVRASLPFSEFADDIVGMATAISNFSPTFAAKELTSLLAHVPLENVRREGKLP